MSSWRVELVEHHIQVENNHQMEEMLATLAGEDPIRNEISGKKYHGVEAVAGRYAELWSAFPDFNVMPTRFTEQNGIVVMEADYSGTHLGQYLGVNGTGKKFNIKLVNVFEFQDELILVENIYIDLLTQLKQLEFNIKIS